MKFLSWLLFASLSISAVAAPKLITTPNPNGHPEFAEAILNAKTQVRLSIFNMSNPQIIEALKATAKRGVQVQLMFDNNNGAKPAKAKMLQELRDAGVDVRTSSPEFSIMHQKSMVIDKKIAFVTTMNLTTQAPTTRGYGVITDEKSVVKEMMMMFDQDWENAANKTGLNPQVTNDSLIWSPINSSQKLIDLIRSAKKEIITEVENISYEAIIKALGDAQESGVKVRIITPLCNFNDNPFFNFPALRKLEARGVDVRVMNIPITVDQPYMHAKMMTVDGKQAYIGSINFSYNSVQFAREVGILFDEAAGLKTIKAAFEKDWGHSIPLPADTAGINCPKFGK